MINVCVLVVSIPPGQQQAPNPLDTSLSRTWKPRIAPLFLLVGTADRKRCLWQCEIGRLEEANVVL